MAALTDEQAALAALEEQSVIAPSPAIGVIHPKDRLILYFATSSLSSVPDRSTRLHIKLSLHWALLHDHVCQCTGILASHFIRNVFTTSSSS